LPPDSSFGFAALREGRDCDFGIVLRGLAAFAEAFFATFADFLDVLLAIAFTPTNRLV
jgi:hypothetical protein